MIDRNQLKREAAKYAVKYINPGMIVGLGTGSTSKFALQYISEKLKNMKMSNILGVPSSVSTAKEAQNLNIPLTTLDDHPVIDITIDGADEVNDELNLVKGGGGALLREKVLAQASKQLIIIIDEFKLSKNLGTNRALPIEVLPIAWRPESLYLESLGAKISMRENPDGTTFKTDQDNLILDAKFDEIKDPKTLALKLNQRAGIIEHGLFIGLATEIIISGEKGIRVIRK